jgi:GNAT superfamily N-acetyltransferase
MSDRPVPSLTAIPIKHDSSEFAEVRDWPFADPYIGRMLREDIPRRVTLWDCRIWIYRDPEDQAVGFGTIDVCDDYCDFTNNRLHPYIPLLAVEPSMGGRGYGARIVRHLIDRAGVIAWETGCHNILYLDVYAENDRTIKLYEKSGFMKTGDEPRLDPKEGNKAYIIMFK